MNKPCGYCGKPVLYFYDYEMYMKMIPISKYWKTVDDYRFTKIIEPYCGALCGLKKWRMNNPNY